MCRYVYIFMLIHIYIFFFSKVGKWQKNKGWCSACILRVACLITNQAIGTSPKKSGQYRLRSVLAKTASREPFARPPAPRVRATVAHFAAARLPCPAENTVSAKQAHSLGFGPSRAFLLRKKLNFYPYCGKFLPGAITQDEHKQVLPKLPYTGLRDLRFCSSQSYKYTGPSKSGSAPLRFPDCHERADSCILSRDHMARKCRSGTRGGKTNCVMLRRQIQTNSSYLEWKRMAFHSF